MGQQEVFTFLKKNRNKWFTSRQIADKLKASYGSVSVSIMKLRRYAPKHMEGWENSFICINELRKCLMIDY